MENTKRQGHPFAPISLYIGAGVYHGVYDKAIAHLPMAVELRQHIVANLKPTSCGKLLDLGCGTGRIGATVLERYPDTILFGVDYSHEMADVAVSNGYQSDHLVVGPKEANLKQLDWTKYFADCTFDNITMNMVAYMLDHDELSLVVNSATKKLKDGGHFIFTIINSAGSDIQFLNLLKTQLKNIELLSEEDISKVVSANTALVASANKYDLKTIDQITSSTQLTLVKHIPVYCGFAELLCYKKR